MDELEWVYVLHNGGGRTRVFSDFDTLCKFIIKQCMKDNYITNIIEYASKREEDIDYIRDVFEERKEMTLSGFFMKVGNNKYRFIYDEDLLVEYLKIE